MLGRVDSPVLVVAGEADALTGPVHGRAVAGAIQGARLELVAGSGHSPHVERPDALARAAVPFLASR